MAQQVPSANLQAIYGDRNVEQATILPDLASAAGNNSDLRVSTNTADLNNYQVLELTNLFQESEFAYYDFTINNNTQLMCTFKTPNWIDLSEIQVEFPVQFTITGTGTAGAINGFNGFGQENADMGRYCEFPEAPLLGGFTRIELALGENSVPVGRTQMDYLIGLKHTATDIKLSQHAMTEYIKSIGPPNTHNLDTVVNTAFADFSKFYSTQAHSELPPEVQNEWNKIVSEIAGYCQYRLDNAANTLSTTVMSFPLKALNSACRYSYLLPPRTAVRLTIEIKTSNFIIAQNVPYRKSYDPGSVSDVFSLYMRLLNAGVGNNTLPRLIMKSHRLTPQSQISLNERWARKPMLVNYETYELKEVKMDGTSIYYEADMNISQQRPTVVYLKIVPTAGLTAPVVRNLVTNAALNTNIIKGVRDYPDSACSAVVFRDIYIDFAGHENIRYETRSPHQWSVNVLHSGLEHIDESINERTYQTLDRRPLMIYNTQNKYDGTIVKINLNPGDREQHAYLAQDKGAVSIRLRCFVQNAVEDNANNIKPLPVGYRLLILKTLPEQFTLDAEGKVNVISWPAVKVDNGFIISQTPNTNF